MHTIATEDRVKRRQLIMTIQRYYSSVRFAKYLIKNELVEDLAKLTSPEMTQLLSDIKFSIQNRNTGDMIQRGVPELICAAEPLVSRFYDVKGVSSVLVRSETFKDILEEVALESQVFSDTPASTRLLYEVVKACFFTHEMNAAHRKAAEAVKEKEVKVSDAVKDLIA
jgi:hypothetical protein